MRNISLVAPRRNQGRKSEGSRRKIKEIEVDAPAIRLRCPTNSFGFRVTLKDDLMCREVHKVLGKSTGLGICRFLIILFESNEQLPSTRKMCDDLIKEIVIAEFPHSRTVKRLCDRHLVSYYRSHYNSGNLIPGEDKPKIRSRRYSHQGKLANSRTGRVLKGALLTVMKKEIEQEYKLAGSEPFTSNCVSGPIRK